MDGPSPLRVAAGWGEVMDRPSPREKALHCLDQRFDLGLGESAFLEAHGHPTLVGFQCRNFGAADHDLSRFNHVRRVADQLGKNLLSGQSFAASPSLHDGLCALLDLGRRFGQPQDDGFHLALPLTQTDLAQLVATSRQRLNQGIQDLRRLGVLETREAQITVLSTAALQRRAGLPAQR